MTDRAKDVPVPAPEQVFYIAPDGDNSNDGRSPNASSDGSGPLATLAGARNAIRQARRDGEQGPFAVEARGGWYFLDEPFVLQPEDSGSANAPIVYRNYRGEQPIFSGGRLIEGFRAETILGREGWVADLPEPMKFTQLFVDHQRCFRPRLPKEGMYRIESTGESSSENEGDGLDWSVQVRQFVYREGDIDPNWRNLTDVALVIPKLWYETHANVVSIDSAGRKVTLDSHMIGGAGVGEGECAPYWIENVFEAMSRPGEFYLDRSENRLYYLPRPGQTPAGSQVFAPMLDRLVSFEGDPFGRHVEHIRFEGLEFRHAEYAYPPGDPGSVQAAFRAPGAITFRGAERCTLYGCVVTQVAQYAVEFRLGSTQNEVIACHLHDLGAGGVKVNHDRGNRASAHEDIVRLSSDPAFGVGVPEGQDADALPAQRVTVSDCSIHDAGVIFPSAVGIWIGDSCGNRIRHNEIHRVGYSGISCGWIWVYEHDGRSVDNLIEYNHIHHLNQDRILSDMAGIYTLGPSAGLVLRHNLVHDIYRSQAGYGDWGIYHDGCCSFVYDEGNAAFGCGYGGLFNNFGRQNHYRRNILINDKTTNYPAVHNQNDHGLLTMVAEENLFVSVTPQVIVVKDNLGHVRFRGNTYISPVGRYGWGVWPFEGEMTPLEDLEPADTVEGERISHSSIGHSQSGRLYVRDDADFMDDEWKRILGELRKAGPRTFTSALPPYAEWPNDTPGPQPALMPVFELDQPMLKKIDMMVPKFEAVVGQPLPVRLRLINHGILPAGGRVTIQPENQDKAELNGETEVHVDVPPGGEHLVEFSVTLRDAADRALVTARMEDNAAFHPAGIFLYPKQMETE